MEKQEGRIRFQKRYDPPEIHLLMNYMRSKEEPRKVIYNSEASKLPIEEYEKYQDCVGIYCIKCGELQEYTYSDDDEFPSFKPCKCCRVVSYGNCVNVNRGRNSGSSLWNSFPSHLIVSECEDKIRIGVTCKSYYFNPKAMKPYIETFHIMIVINTTTGQTYCLPVKYKDKVVFGPGKIRNISFSDQFVLKWMDNLVLKTAPEAVKVLNEIYSEKILKPFTDYKSFTEIVHANYFKELYPYFQSSVKNIDTTFTIDIWRSLRKRYKKNPETFPKYLYYGCSSVATKSIKRILYKQPEQKWVLYFLYKILGFTNTDIIRNALSSDSEIEAGKNILLQMFFRSKTEIKLIKKLSEACINAGMTEKERAQWFTKNLTGYLLRDTAKLYDENDFSPEDIKVCKSLQEMHDKLVEINMRNKNAKLWERYNSPIKYDDKISKLEGPCGNAEFSVINVPWKLRSLGERFHNCVGTYMEDVKRERSVIVEMTLGGKPAACIELDRSGKEYRQAYGVCNSILEGAAASSFKKWTKEHSIVPMGQRPYPGHIPDLFADVDEFDIPF